MRLAEDHCLGTEKMLVPPGIQNLLRPAQLLGICALGNGSLPRFFHCHIAGDRYNLVFGERITLCSFCW